MHEHKHDHHEHGCDCGCGHEHHEHAHHHHDHDCDCGHEQHHHEHHEHDCGCGHEHHEHHHEHAHCGGDCHDSGCNCSDCTATGFRLTRVEGATAAAVRFAMKGPQGVAEVEITRRVKALCDDIHGQGGLVGHIKGAITGEAEVSTFSCTGGAVTIGRKNEMPGCKVDLVAIILGLSDEAIENAVRARFPEI